MTRLRKPESIDVCHGRDGRARRSETFSASDRAEPHLHVPGVPLRFLRSERRHATHGRYGRGTRAQSQAEPDGSQLLAHAGIL